MAERSRMLRKAVAKALRQHGPKMLEGVVRGMQQRRAWRTYAASAINGAAANLTHDEIPVLCGIAAQIADEMTRQEAERAESKET